MLRIRKQATKRDVLVFAMAEIHDRMPAILERSDIKTWLNKNLTGQQRTTFLQATPCLPQTLKITVEKAY